MYQKAGSLENDVSACLFTFKMELCLLCTIFSLIWFWPTPTHQPAFSISWPLRKPTITFSEACESRLTEAFCTAGLATSGSSVPPFPKTLSTHFCIHELTLITLKHSLCHRGNQEFTSQWCHSYMWQGVHPSPKPLKHQGHKEIGANPSWLAGYTLVSNKGLTQTTIYTYLPTYGQFRVAS